MTLKGFKTFFFNFVMLALASPDFLALIPPRLAIYITVVGNLCLRAITTTAPGKSS
jgi:hypothetical protein